ncbi:hypothetical protein M2405_004025 [Rhodococcus erythropolis]|uniref:hypothetical protein n=1 Tax=Rhodococcus erythropolis TaxID=1833 RepID=UPI0021682BCA|nr:hypothetical protein [Rhodococcus erythropolis]MCS4255722.1 hypothetical protein [Rhodococcus erythropolis]MCW2425236.1 hypothetical protein [Rhodococcus erythropolis]
MSSSHVAAVVLRGVLGVMCVLTLMTSAFAVFTDRSVPLWLLWTEVVVVVGLMAVLAYGERRV